MNKDGNQLKYQEIYDFIIFPANNIMTWKKKIKESKQLLNN